VIEEGEPGSPEYHHLCPEHRRVLATIEWPDEPSKIRIRPPGWKLWSEWEKEEGAR
jgi:hypothetical protein